MTNFLMQAQPNASAAFITQIGIIALMFAFLYFFMIRPQKKRDKEMQQMRNAIEVGDEVVTIGGIVGIVVNVKEDTLVLETGSDRNKIRITKWAVQSNITENERKIAEKKAKEQKALEEKRAEASGKKSK